MASTELIHMALYPDGSAIEISRHAFISGIFEGLSIDLEWCFDDDTHDLLVRNISEIVIDNLHDELRGYLTAKVEICWKFVDYTTDFNDMLITDQQRLVTIMNDPGAVDKPTVRLTICEMGWERDLPAEDRARWVQLTTTGEHSRTTNWSRQDWWLQGFGAGLAESESGESESGESQSVEYECAWLGGVVYESPEYDSGESESDVSEELNYP